MAAGFLLLSLAAIDVTIAGSHASGNESTLESPAGEPVASFPSKDDQAATLSGNEPVQAADGTAPNGDRATERPNTSTKRDSPEVIAAAAASKTPNSGQGASQTRK